MLLFIITTFWFYMILLHTSTLYSGQSGAVTGDAGMQAVEMGKRFDAMEALLVSMNATMKHMR